jgi:hypothetical protein
MLQFTRHSKAGSQPVAYASTQLVIAGWAARDEAAVKHHIEELAEIGVPPPSSVPLFYRTAASLLTQSERMEVLGPDSSGEVEPVIVSMDDGLWLTIGSDHTRAFGSRRAVRRAPSGVERPLCAQKRSPRNRWVRSRRILR